MSWLRASVGAAVVFTSAASFATAVAEPPPPLAEIITGRFTPNLDEAEARDGTDRKREPTPTEGVTPSDCARPELNARIDIPGVASHTELELIFDRTKASDDDGVEIVVAGQLPKGAAVHRLAMTVDGKLTEGRLVDRDQGSAAYEHIVETRRDPAVVEQDGERFRLRLFPVLPGERKVVVLAWDAPVKHRAGSASYHLAHFEAFCEARPLPLPPAKTRLRRAPDTTWRDGPTLGAGGQIVVPRPAGLVGNHGTVLLPAPQVRARKPRSLVVALDTSRSMRDDLLAARRLASALLSQWPGPTAAVVGDLEAEVCGADVQRCLSRVDAVGASNLEGLMEAAVATAEPLPEPVDIVVVSDGESNWGNELLQELRKPTRGVPSRFRIHWLDVAGSGVGRLANLATASGGVVRFTPAPEVSSDSQQRGRWVPGFITEIRQMRAPVRFEVRSGKTEDLRMGRNGATIALKLGSSTARLDAVSVVRGRTIRRPMVINRARLVRSAIADRLAAKLELDELEATDTPPWHIAQRSAELGVLSSESCFLVLESEAEFSWVESFEEDGGYDRVGANYSSSLRASYLPSTRAVGSLSRSEILTEIQHHLDGVRKCFGAHVGETERSFKVVVGWRIDADGYATDVTTLSNGSGNWVVSRCIENIVSRMQFPRPAYGSVEVRFPFISPWGSAADLEGTQRDDPFRLVQLLDAGRVRQARELLARYVEADRVKVLLSTDIERRELADIWLPPALFHLARTPEDHALRRAVIETAMVDSRPETLKAALIGETDTQRARSLVSLGFQYGYQQQVLEVLVHWHEHRSFPVEDLLDMVEPLYGDTKARRFHARLLEHVVKKGRPTRQQLREFLGYAEPDSARGRIAARACEDGRADVGWCLDHVAIETIAPTAFPRWARTLWAERSRRDDDPRWVADMAHVLELLGHRRAALRLASELLEHEPQTDAVAAAVDLFDRLGHDRLGFALARALIKNQSGDHEVWQLLKGFLGRHPGWRDRVVRELLPELAGGPRGFAAVVVWDDETDIDLLVDEPDGRRVRNQVAGRLGRIPTDARRGGIEYYRSNGSSGEFRVLVAMPRGGKAAATVYVYDDGNVEVWDLDLDLDEDETFVVTNDELRSGHDTRHGTNSERLVSE